MWRLESFQELKLRVSSPCQTAAYQYSAPWQERGREMDETQEGGRLKRQMKGRHTERSDNGMRRWQREGPKGEWIKEKQRERERGRGKETLNIELKTEGEQIWKKKGSNIVLHLGREKGAPRPETIHPFLLLEAKKRTGRQQCTMGVLRHLIGRWREAGWEPGSNWEALKKIICVEGQLSTMSHS